MLEEKHLSDEVSNNILNYIAEHQTMKNDINLASPILEKYIKDKYVFYQCVRRIFRISYKA